MNTMTRPIRNPFRSEFLRNGFGTMVSAYAEKRRVLFVRQGIRNRGSSFATWFWQGYDGQKISGGFVDRASRETLMYAMWRAGEACRRADQLSAHHRPHNKT